MLTLCIKAFKWKPIRIDAGVDLVVVGLEPGQLCSIQGHFSRCLHFQVDTGTQPAGFNGVHLFRGDC